MMTPFSTVGTRKERQSDISGFTLTPFLFLNLKTKAAIQQPDSMKAMDGKQAIIKWQQ